VKCRVRRHHVQTRSSRIMSRMRTALQCHIPRPRVLRSSTGPDAPVYWPARGLRTLNGWAAGPCRQFWGLGRSAHVSASPPENHCIASSDLLAGRFKPSPNAEALPWALRPSRKRQARRQNRQPCQNRERMSPYAAPCPRAPPRAANKLPTAESRRAYCRRDPPPTKNCLKTDGIFFSPAA
jgi:hypothetical protein